MTFFHLTIVRPQNIKMFFNARQKDIKNGSCKWSPCSASKNTHTHTLPRWLPHRVSAIYCSNTPVFQTNDFTLNYVWGGYQRKNLAFSLSYRQTAIRTTFPKRLRNRHQPSIFYLFLFIDDNVHHNFYTMMFHVVSINLLKLFLRFILLLPGGLYIWCYGPYTCCCAEKHG